MKTVLVIAPHPDDETLGAGGYLHRLRAEGAQIHWVILTDASVEYGWPAPFVENRQKEIRKVITSFGVAKLHNFALRPAGLDTYPRREIIERLSSVFRDVASQIIISPWKGDPHSDHKIAFECAVAASKPFRLPSLRMLLAMEIPSETNFHSEDAFEPNYWVDISDYLEAKIDTLRVYASEMDEHPFPRSEQSIRALATLRGAQASVVAAEAFRVVRLIERS